METTIKTQHTTTFSKTQTKSKEKTDVKNLLFWDKIEFMRYGIMPILLTIIGCLGGFAAAFGAKDDALKIALIAFPTITSLALMLAVSPMRLIFWVSSIALTLDLIVLIF